ncbi:MAG: SDR family NAD(P)-dependent oxidoreductase [bacterium]
MTGLDDFHFMATSFAGFLAPDIALAAIRAGEIGILNGESAPSETALSSALAELRNAPRDQCGLRLDLGDATIAPGLLKNLPPQVGWVILTRTNPAEVGGHILHLHEHAVRVLIESVDLETAQAAEMAGADGIIAKGNESGGWVGEETTFILLQRLRDVITLPIWIQGGIGSHTLAAAFVGGAAGVVLDSQLALLRESPLPPQLRARIGHMDGSETHCPEAETPLRFRSLASFEKNDGAHQLPLGQDAGFAHRLAERYGTVERTLRGLRADLSSHLRSVQRADLLVEGSAWARAHDTTYPIAQGPMTRVSDTPAFAAAVAEAGALPFLALGVQRGEEIESLLAETNRRFDGRPWGVGLLGFLETPLREEQMAVVRRHHPPYALIAGGHPEQAKLLEQDGIQTYLHVPSPGLLKLFIEDGARRFVFEGRECGGHVGPLSSFVLWEQAAQILLELVPENELPSCHVLLAGGIHDALSAAMAAASMASLSERGVKIGFLMGTAYLFTREAVSSGAILKTFQRQALECRHTVLLETGPGHVVRCAPTPYAESFSLQKAKLKAEGISADQLRVSLETLNIGRLRLAAKGVARQHGSPEALTPVDEKEQLAGGLYMLGQAAALHIEVCTMKELHQNISMGGTAILREAIRQADNTPAPQRSANRRGIAIVGMSCLLPGARDLSQFWTNILDKTNSIREVPASRWDWKLYFNEQRDATDRIYARWGGFLDPVPFDPAQYGMPPSSLASIEPIQLLALEVARAALRDAGYETRPFSRENTSVIIGVSGGLAELGQDYVLRSALSAGSGSNALAGVHRDLPEWTEDSFAGILLNVIAGRIANRFDLGGPTFAVDAACASSLAALYLACRELDSGASDMVLAGGADTFQSPFNYLCFCKTHALSPRGRCRTFDHTADGTCISEGLSMLVLKRVEDAERDGDRIYAVIRGVGASSDGRAKGLTAPSPEGQIRALSRAYAVADILPSTVGLIEAHGTGTVAGDRAETESLRQIFGAAGSAPNSVALGSVKSMIGHTKGAAGITGLLKVALALHHKVLPATIGVEKPNDSLTGGPLYANTETRPWIAPPGNQPRRAGVSAFGFGGANYHAIIEEYEAESSGAITVNWPSEIFLWRGASPADILKKTTGLAAALKAGAKPELKDLSFTLWRRSQQNAEPSTLAIVASSLDDLAAKLDTLAGKLNADTTATVWDASAGIYLSSQAMARNASIAFLFPGQGSQYPDMLRELAVHFHEIRTTFEMADRVLAGRFERPLSSFVFPPPRFSEDEDRAARQALTATNVAQPALGAASTGLLKLLQALGVTPHMVAGHSYGEYSALCAAGCLTPEMLFDLSESRGRFIMEEARGDLGTMAAVEADEVKTCELIGTLPDLWIANLNSPRQTIISGTKAAITEALKQLEAKDIAAQAIPVACAFHSPLVSPAKERLQKLIGELRFETPVVRVFSNTTGGEYPPDHAAIQSRLGEHLVSPVRFVSEIEAMYAAGARVFVEVGPRTILSGLTDQILGNRERVVVPLETRKRSGLDGLLHALAQLAAHGAPVSLNRLYEDRQPREHDLERLVEETQTTPYSQTTWWVDGGRATPMQANKITSGAATPTTIPIIPMPSTPSTPASTAPIRHSPSPTDSRAAILQAHEQVMQRLLETHRRVMLAFAPGTVPQSLPTQATPVERAATVSVAPLPATPSPTPAQATQPGAYTDHVRTEVLRIVGERTGYPPDMLEVDADLEAELGIDSIKRVEISGRLRKAFPHLGPTPDSSSAGNLAVLKTLRQLIDRITSVPLPGGSGTTPPTLSPGSPAKNEKDLAGSPPAARVHVPRFMMRMEDAPMQNSPASIPRDGVFLITDDEGGVAEAVAESIRALGSHAIVVSAKERPGGAAGCYLTDFTNPQALHTLVRAIRKTEGWVAGIIHLLPLRGRAPAREMSLARWRRALQEDVKALFYLTQAAADDLKTPPPSGRTRILAAVETDGDFPGHGGITGLVNTFATEWPTVSASTLALSRSESIPVLKQRIMGELQCGNDSRFAGFSSGCRQEVSIAPAELDRGTGEPLHIGSDWVILVTGGARGITAQVCLELAERFKPTLVLAGRSPLPAVEEAATTRDIASPEELRRILARQLAGSNGKAAPLVIEAAYRRLCGEREIRANLASLQRSGSRVNYLPLDVRDEPSFAGAIDQIYAEFGRLDGVIHGAGLIEDKRVEDKTPESFDRVFDTKADGAFLLTRRLRLESLKFAAFFSSVASLGNAGQSDYAAANGVLNALARDLDRRMTGRVVALLWGPWQSAGMASEEVLHRFQDMGVQVIPPDAGRRCFIDELQYGRKGDVEVLLGDAPYSRPHIPESGRTGLPLVGAGSVIHNNGTLEVACTLDPARHAYLYDHMLDGKPVFPAAMAMELMAESAWAASLSPRGGIEISSLQVQKGIVVEQDQPKTLLVRGLRVKPHPETAHAEAFSMEIRGADTGNRAHYRAIVTLGVESAPVTSMSMDVGALKPFDLSVSEAYRQWLFQGRCFAGITAIEGIREDAIVGILQSVPPEVCLPGSSHSQWILDPTILDASFQLAILWERYWHDMTPLPMQMGRFRLFHAFSRQPVRCVLKAVTQDGGELLTTDHYYTDSQGRLLAVMEGMIFSCTKALNRLTGSEGHRPVFSDAGRNGVTG